MRFLALGDSYTIGEGVTDAERWPMRLAQTLRADGIAINDPEIIAVTGWTTDELDAGIDVAMPRPPYDLVSLLIGVNNQYRGRDVANYGDEFHALLQRAIGFAGDAADHVMVVSIPDWGVTRFADENACDREQVATAIDACNAAARDMALTAGAVWVDIAGISRTCGNASAMLAADGLHPSALQYDRWLERIVPAARAILAA